MSAGEEIYQAIRVASPQKLIDEINKMEKLTEKIANTETGIFLHRLRVLLDKCKREPKG